MTIGSKQAHSVILQAVPGKFVTLIKIAPTGSLQIRRARRNGTVTFYWRYSFGNATARHPIGVYDATRPPKSLEPDGERYSFAAAIWAAQELAVKHNARRDTGGLRAALDDDRQKSVSTTSGASLGPADNTLQALLNAYTEHLERLGRMSHRDARSIFRLHVTEAFPDIAAQPAVEFSDEQAADLLRRVLVAGKGRTANKLRAYLHAAFETARRARTDPTVPVAFKAFNIRLNPIADTGSAPSANRADKNPLSLEELRMYWRLLQRRDDHKGAILRIHLLTGAQRIAQFVRLETAGVIANDMLLHDGKGRPGKPPRRHLLPLTPAVKNDLKFIAPAGKFAFSTDGGKTHISNTTLSSWAKDVVGDHIPGFQAKRLRSGVETALAAAGVAESVRGRLQSHGISGIQATHYDGYEYRNEKLQALKVLLHLLSVEDVPVAPGE